MDENKHFLSHCSFNVRIDGMQWETYESVSGLGLDVEDIPYQGDKRMILNRPGRVNARDLTLVRRFKKDKELHDWIKSVQDGKTQRKSGSVVLKDDEGSDVCRFDFFEAWPKAWSGPELTKDSAGNDVLMETVTLSIEDLKLE